MAYIPPPPGATTLGKPTPAELPKQEVQIKDLPPEARRSFILSMVFFPSLVGAGICLLIFLAYYGLRSPKTPADYARELREGLSADNRRSRWQTAREIAENLNSPGVQDPAVLGALLEIVRNPALDEEGATWTPSLMIRGEAETHSYLRWWAAYLAGFIAARLQDPRGMEALVKTLAETDEKNPKAAAGLRFYSAVGLGLIKDPRAIPALVERLGQDPDPVVQAAAAKSLGAIGAQLQAGGQAPAGPAPQAGLEDLRAALQQAYRRASDPSVSWNLAIALARVKDDSGRKTLEGLVKSEDPVIQRNARQALALLDGPASR